jgi:hypothetical protein
VVLRAGAESWGLKRARIVPRKATEVTTLSIPCLPAPASSPERGCLSATPGAGKPVAQGARGRRGDNSSSGPLLCLNERDLLLLWGILRALIRFELRTVLGNSTGNLLE